MTTDQPTPEPVTAADELRIEIDELVSQIRALRGEEASRDPSLPLAWEREDVAAHRALNYIHGYAIALLLKKDIEGAIRQRQKLRQQAPWPLAIRFAKDVNGEISGDDTTKADIAGDRPLTRPVDFPPIANGIDYLKSVVDHLTVKPEPLPRDLKYAVLHLYAATEVLLKARLRQEHWALVWADPKTATIKQRETRNFQSCGAETAIERLGSVLDIQVSEDSTKAVARLGKTRNQLQHDGLTLSALAIEAQAAEVLDFLHAFLHQHLGISADSSHSEDLQEIRDKVSGIKAFVQKRRVRLSRALDPALTVQCPDCGEWALDVSGQVTVTCHFCDTSTDAYRMASRYAETILGVSRAALEDNGRWPVQGCAACPEAAMVADAVTLADHQKRGPQAVPEHGEHSHVDPAQSTYTAAIRYLCFSCARRFDSAALTSCAQCGVLCEPTEDGTDHCWECESLFRPLY